MNHSISDLRKQEIKISRITMIWISKRILLGFKIAFAVVMMAG